MTALTIHQEGSSELSEHLSAPAFICRIIIKSLKVRCMQPAVYLALESSHPDTRLMGLTPHISNPPLKSLETCFEADCLSGCVLPPRPVVPSLLGVLFSLGSFSLCLCFLPSTSVFSSINHVTAIPLLVRFHPLTHQPSLSVPCLIFSVILLLLLCSSVGFFFFFFKIFLCGPF